MVPVVLVVRHGRVGDTKWGDDMPPLCLLKDSSEVREEVEVGELGQSIRAGNCVEFLLGFHLRFGMHGHGEEKSFHGRVGLYARVGPCQQWL